MGPSSRVGLPIAVIGADFEDNATLELAHRIHGHWGGHRCRRLRGDPDQDLGRGMLLLLLLVLLLLLLGE